MRRTLLGCLVASLVALVLLLAQTRLTISPNAASLAFALAGIALLLLSLAWRGHAVRWKRLVASGAEDVLIFAAISLMGAIASYAVAADTQGWIDGPLARMDRTIGFDWNDWYRVVSASRFLQVAGTGVYASIFVTPAILICAFTAREQKSDARLFLMAFWLAAVISLFLFQYLPTLGPLAYLWHGPIGYMPTSGLYQADLIPLLRDRQLDSIDLGALRGLVGPPSFHAASAVLYVLAAWRIRRFRIALTALNVAMLLSIPVEGTHYAMDVISGALVALMSWGLARLYMRIVMPRASSA